MKGPVPQERVSTAASSDGLLLAKLRVPFCNLMQRCAAGMLCCVAGMHRVK